MKLLNAQCKVEVVSKLLNPHIHLSGSGVCGRSGSAWCFHSLLVCKGNREPTACTSHVTQPLPVAAWGAHGGRGGGSPASAQAHPALLPGPDTPRTASYPAWFAVAEPDPDVGYL